MTPDGADKPEGNHHHDEQRPAVRAEYPGQHQINQDECNQGAALHVGERLALIGLTTLKRKCHTVARLKLA